VLSAVADAIGDGKVTVDAAFDCGLYIASTLERPPFLVLEQAVPEVELNDGGLHSSNDQTARGHSILQ
jgi:hypothetical protein